MSFKEAKLIELMAALMNLRDHHIKIAMSLLEAKGVQNKHVRKIFMDKFNDLHRSYMKVIGQEFGLRYEE